MISIIGGGIGGLSAALALRRAGFEPQVFEQAPELLDVGAAIAVWPNAMRALDALGLAERVIEKAGVIEHVRWMNRDGRLFNHIEFPRTKAPAVALHRADLQHALLQALPAGCVHLGKRFESYSHVDNRIQANFADGTQLGCDLLIAADGLHSIARRQLLNDDPLVYRGYSVWRGITTSTAHKLPPSTAMEIYGSGQRFGIGPVGMGRVGWWATANELEGEAEDVSEHQRKLLKLFDGWYAPVTDLIASTPTTSILRNAAYDRTPAHTWGAAHLILLGDAAHPTTPNFGQGGCMAIEDALVLSRCLSKYADSRDALRRYTALRRARTYAITRYSMLYGSIGQWTGRARVQFRTALLSTLPEALIRRAMRLVFDYDASAVEV